MSFKLCPRPSGNSRFTQLRSFRLPEIFISRRMFYLGGEKSVRFHSQLREAATRYQQCAVRKKPLIIMKNLVITLLIISSIFVSNCQTKEDGVFMGKKFAEDELDLALSKNRQHNVLDSGENIVKNSETAIKIVEPILYEIYGKKQIESEKPYEIYFIKNYWIIQGTLPEKSKGGTFIIIINAKDSQVLKVSHGK